MDLTEGRPEWLLVLAMVAGCGSATTSATETARAKDDRVPVVNGSGDAGRPADRPADAGLAVPQTGESGSDAGGSSAAPDAKPTPLPPACTDESTKQIYFLLLRGTLFSDLHGDLYRLDPASDSTWKLGAIACAVPEGGFPYAMAVDASGVVWVYYWYDRIYRVDPADMSCSATDYVTALGEPSLPFVFSMTSAGETTASPVLHTGLDNPQFTEQPCRLGRVEPLAPSARATGVLGLDHLDYVALAGRDNGQLFGLNEDRLFELDPISGERLSQETLPRVQRSWPTSFAFWGDDVYLFGSYGLSDKAVEAIHYARGTGRMRLVTSFASNDGEVLLAIGAGSGPCISPLTR